MANFTEKRFDDWSKMLDLDFDPNIFTNLYFKYINDFAPLIESFLKDLFNEIRTQLPNVDFYLKGRFKSETSFIYKTFLKLTDNIYSLFDNTISDEERSKTIHTYFGFIKDKEMYENIKSKIFEIASQVHDITDLEDFNVTMQEFQKILNSMSEKEKNTVIRRLGETEDIFAYRTVVTSVGFDIKDITTSKDGQVQIVDSAWNTITISPSIKLNPDKDIYENKFRKKCATIDGVETVLSDKNLLYDTSIAFKDRTFDNAKRDINGNITFLRDSFKLSNGEVLDISSIYFSPEYNAYFFESNGEKRNLSEILKNSPVQLLKNDSKTCIEYVKKIDMVELDFQRKNNYIPLMEKRKNYIDTPKPDSNYQSIHTSSHNKDFNFIVEGQTRTFEMEDDAKSEHLLTGHDNYKQEKMTKKIESRPILEKIKANDPTAFDSSATTTMELLSSHLPEIELYEVLPRYILVAPIGNFISSYVPSQDVIFDHFFENVSNKQKDIIRKKTGIDFTNYKTYLSSILKIQSKGDDEPSL